MILQIKLGFLVYFIANYYLLEVNNAMHKCKKPTINKTIFISETNISNHPAADRHPVWSDDMQKIVFESDRTGKWGIFEYNIINNSTVCLVCDSFNNKSPNYFDQDSKLIYESDKSGKSEIYSYNLRSKKINKILNEPNMSYSQFYPTATKNSKIIAFTAKSVLNEFAIFIYFFNGKKIKQLTDFKQRSLYPTWQKKSNSIIYFGRQSDEDDELYQYNLITQEITRLTDNNVHDYCPNWNSQLASVVFVRSFGEASKTEIFQLNLKTKNEKQLTDNSLADTEPNTSNDGKKMAWSGYRNGNYEILKTDLTQK